MFAILTFMHQTNLNAFLDGFLVIDFLSFVCLEFIFEQKLWCKRNAIYIVSFLPIDLGIIRIKNRLYT